MPDTVVAEAVANAENKTLRTIVLFAIPIFVSGLLAWHTWVTNRLFAIEKTLGTHATAEQLHQTESRILARLDDDIRALNQRIATLPPADWRDRIIALEVDVKQINQGVARIEAVLDVVREDQKRKGT